MINAGNAELIGLQIFHCYPENNEKTETVNDFTYSVEITRSELCTLILGCTLLNKKSSQDTKKWIKLHDKLVEILHEFDEKRSF